MKTFFDLVIRFFHNICTLLRIRITSNKESIKLAVDKDGDGDPDIQLSIKTTSSGKFIGQRGDDHSQASDDCK